MNVLDMFLNFYKHFMGTKKQKRPLLQNLLVGYQFAIPALNCTFIPPFYINTFNCLTNVKPQIYNLKYLFTFSHEG